MAIRLVLVTKRFFYLRYYVSGILLKNKYTTHMILLLGI